MPLFAVGLGWFATGFVSHAVAQDAPIFSSSETSAIQAYWSAPDRYSTQPYKGAGPAYVVRLTPEGSAWLLAYDHARGLSKINPGADQAPQNADQAAFKQWIDAKIAYDRYRAATDCAKNNQTDPPAEVPDPGPEPDGLQSLAGPAPTFAAAVQPTEYVVRFDDGKEFRYVDQVAARPRYAYFRFSNGIETGGQSLKTLGANEFGRLCTAAGLSPMESRVLAAISPLEGGFDSVNTYDTGYVSVGFIQFACLSSGAGSLGSTLLAEKRTQPSDFQNDFRRFGIDVTADGKLACLDPVTGACLTGTDAARKIIDDKRLTAVFQRAGQGDAYRIAQLSTARDLFYPANDLIPVSTDLGTVNCRVGDFVRSEAGLAILADRKINTGNIRKLADVVSDVMTRYALKSVDDLSLHEGEIVAAMVFRKNFLLEASLSQPGGFDRDRTIGSRGGDRTSRGGGHSGGGDPASSGGRDESGGL